MKISVIVPIYNVEKYLKRCIESIISQNYKDFEIILVNDGSTDQSLRICNEYENRDSRIKVINQRNIGLSGARNTGIKNATGEYLCFIDADDKVDSDMILSYFAIINKYRPDIITTNIFQYRIGNDEFTETRNDLPYNRILKKEELINSFIKPYYGGYLGIIPAAWNKCYKKSFLIENFLSFDQSLKRSEDYWFNFYAFQKSESVYAIDKSFYHYYANEGSMIRSFREGQFDTFLKNRHTLLKKHDGFFFPIDWIELNNQFVRNINELILLEINVKGIRKAYKSISSYLSNSEFLEIYKKSYSPKIHIKIIRALLMKNMVFFAVLIYCIWALRSK